MRSSVLSQKRIRERKKERNRAKKHVASNFISCFPLSVPSKRTLILPAGSHSHRTSPLTYTSLFLTVTESCFQKRYKVQEVQGCPEYLQRGMLTGGILFSLSQSPGNPATFLFHRHFELGCHLPHPLVTL